jgi:dolichyl-phosphate beta-glucosyltransferase
MTGRSLSVVVPAYNEARRIDQTIDTLCRELPAMVDDWELRVVDDGSTDDTAARVARHAANEPRVVLQREPHRGKGGTVRAGILAARGQWAFMCDADLSMPPRELPRFLALVPDAADIALGSRELAGARRIGEPAHRHWLGRGFNGAVRLLALPGIQDTQCGFKLFSRSAVQQVFPLVTTDGWAFDIEVLVIARELGLRLVEVPVEWHYGEESRVSLLSTPIEMASELWRIRRRARAGHYRRHRPSQG